jgi:hypothetical protein
LAGAVGAALMWRSASRTELIVFGTSQIALGFGALAALLLMRASMEHTEWSDWSAPARSIGPWVLGCLGAAVLGVTSIVYAFRSKLSMSRAVA